VSGKAGQNVSYVSSILALFYAAIAADLKEGCVLHFLFSFDVSTIEEFLFESSFFPRRHSNPSRMN
jgi:hypothetical protein